MPPGLPLSSVQRGRDLRGKRFTPLPAEVFKIRIAEDSASPLTGEV